MASKKHQEREIKHAAGVMQGAMERAMRDKEAQQAANQPAGGDAPVATITAPAPTAPAAPRLLVDDDADDDEVGMSIDAKIAAARNRLSTAHCLFCTHVAASLEDNLAHMSSAHSFFIPDRDYLVDLPGLLTYLGEKIAVGNTCLACPHGGREFSSTEAVRAHMRDKAHCRIAYDTDDEKLEVSDYYDFESSYPDVEARKVRRAERRARKAEEKQRRDEEEQEREDEEWEAVDEDEDAETDEELVIEGSNEDESDDESELVGSRRCFRRVGPALTVPRFAPRSSR